MNTEGRIMIKNSIYDKSILKEEDLANYTNVPEDSIFKSDEIVFPYYQKKKKKRLPPSFR